MVTNKLLTAEDVWNMPDDGCRRELINGELITAKPAFRMHGRILAELIRRVGNFLIEQPIAEVYAGGTAFILQRDPDLMLAPDLSIVRVERLTSIESEFQFLEIVPDIVAEIVSPLDFIGQINAKVDAYREAGTLLIWLIDPAWRTITIHAPDQHTRLLQGDDTLDGGEVLPGFELPLRELFAA